MRDVGSTQRRQDEDWGRRGFPPPGVCFAHRRVVVSQRGAAAEGAPGRRVPAGRGLRGGGQPRAAQAPARGLSGGAGGARRPGGW